MNRILTQRNESVVNGVHSSPYTSNAAITSPTAGSMAPLGDGVSKMLYIGHKTDRILYLSVCEVLDATYGHEHIF